MSLGQFYYFEKEISRINDFGNPIDLLSVGLLGFDASVTDKLKNITDFNKIPQKVKEIFIPAYTTYLREQNISEALTIWNKLSSPLLVESSTLDLSDSTTTTPKTVFQQELVNWIENGLGFDNLKTQLLPTGFLNDDLTDFALYYGLHVLAVCFEFEKNLLNDSQSTFIQTSSPRLRDLAELNFSADYHIIFVGPSYLKPLFTNIRCIFLDDAEDKNEIIDKIQKAVIQNPIQLVLIESKTKQILGNFTIQDAKNLIISELNLTDSQQDSFFDDLAKQTLGIKLDTVDIN